VLIEEEKSILKDIETTDIFKMRSRIKNYIENNVQLNREGLKITLHNLNDKLAT